MSNKKNICHSMVLVIGGSVYTVCSINDTISSVPIDGERFTSFDKDYWNKFIRNLGVQSSQKTDICIVSDREITPPENLRCSCEPSESVWGLISISQAFDTAAPQINADVKLSGGELLFHYNTYRIGGEPLSLTAHFVNEVSCLEQLNNPYAEQSEPPADDVPKSKEETVEKIEEILSNPDGLAPLAKHFLEELKKDEEAGKR